MLIKTIIVLLIFGSLSVWFGGEILAKADLEFYFDRQKRVAEVSLTKDKKGIFITANLDNNNNFLVNAAVKNISLFNKDAAFDIYAEGFIGKDAAGEYSSAGNVIVKQIVVDGSPLDNVKIDYYCNSKEFFINTCHWENFDLRGKICLSTPFDTNIDVTISEMNLKDFVSMLGIRNQSLTLSGNILGFVNISRKDSLSNIKAQLYSWDGLMQEMEFKEATIVLEGLFPSMRFVNSWLVKNDDSCMGIEGFFNLVKLSDFKSPYHNVRLVPVNNKVEVMNWIVSTKEGTSGLRLQKAISNDIILNMDTFVQNPEEEISQNNDSLSVEYKMKEDQRVKMSIKEKEEIVGWERVFKF